MRELIEVPAEQVRVGDIIHFADMSDPDRMPRVVETTADDFTTEWPDGTRGWVELTRSPVTWKVYRDAGC